MNNLENERLLSAVLAYAVDEPELAAHELAENYCDDTALATADMDCLSHIDSVGASGAHLMRLIFAIRSRKQTDKFKLGRKHTEEEITDYLKALFMPLSNETIYLLLLDAEGRVTSSEYIGEGTVNSSGVLPRKLLEVVMKKRAAGAILAHNHPAGLAKPSCEDVETTALISTLFESADKWLAAHYVIAGDEYAVIK